MKRGKRTVLFADGELAERVMAAIERALPEGQYPFQIEVTGTPDSQLGVRVWNNEGVHVSMGSGVIESARLDQSHTVAAAINTIDRALQLARWQWLHQQGGANAEGRAQRSLVRATGGPCDKNLDHRDAGESRCG